MRSFDFAAPPRLLIKVCASTVLIDKELYVDNQDRKRRVLPSQWNIPNPLISDLQVLPSVHKAPARAAAQFHDPRQDVWIQEA